MACSFQNNCHRQQRFPRTGRTLKRRGCQGLDDVQDSLGRAEEVSLNRNNETLFWFWHRLR